MSWVHLTIDDVRLSLAEDEIDILNTLSLDESKLNLVIQQTSDMVADSFRAAWRAKGYQIDPREHYVSSGYIVFILALIRWTLFTRFPMADNYALSEPRKLQYEKALELLKDPWLATDKVDWTSPELSDYSALSASAGCSIGVPWLRFGYDKLWST